MAIYSAVALECSTTNYYSEKEDLREADIIVTYLGDPDGESGKLKQGGKGIDYDGVLEIDQPIAYFLKIK